jgi:hypothetical protein
MKPLSLVLIGLFCIALFIGIAAAMQPYPTPSEEWVTPRNPFEPTVTIPPTDEPMPTLTREETPIGGGTGYYQFISSPSGAEVSFDGEYKGLTPVMVSVYSSATPGHSVEISKSGYESWYKDLSGNPPAGQTVTVSATLTPINPPTTLPTTTSIGGGTGYYQFISSPSGAEVSFDGEYKGLTPVMVSVYSSATPGHYVEISKVGYETWYESIPGNPPTGQTITKSATLTPIYPPTTQPTVTITVTSIGGDYGYFSITSNPSRSDVSFDGVYQGETPLDVLVYTTANPQHTISVSRAGYNTWVQSYNQNPPAGKTINVNAILQPQTQTGTIAVSSSPSGAYARLDGGDTLITPGSFYSVSQGYHTVDISTPGYQPYTSSILVSAGGTSSVSASLTPTQSWGSLRVTSYPSGAEVYVDEIYRGYTPLTVGSLSTGLHNVRLHLSGYQDYKGTANVPSGGQAVFSASLSQVYQPTTGDIVVSSVPDGATIFLDGTYRGMTLKGNPFDIGGVVPGSHTVMLQKPGFQDYSTTVSVTAGVTSTVSAALFASPIPPKDGSVTVQSDPSGADVYIDNQYKGITPVNVNNVAIGSHVVTLKMNGYTDGTYTVQVGAGQSVQVFGTLSPVSQTTQPTTAKSPLPVSFAFCALVAVAVLFSWRRRE